MAEAVLHDTSALQSCLAMLGYEATHVSACLSALSTGGALTRSLLFVDLDTVVSSCTAWLDAHPQEAASPPGGLLATANDDEVEDLVPQPVRVAQLRSQSSMTSSQGSDENYEYATEDEAYSDGGSEHGGRTGSDGSGGSGGSADGGGGGDGIACVDASWGNAAEVGRQEGERVHADAAGKEAQEQTQQGEGKGSGKGSGKRPKKTYVEDGRKVTALAEMVPDRPLSQLRRALEDARGDVHRAALNLATIDDDEGGGCAGEGKGGGGGEEGGGWGNAQGSDGGLPPFIESAAFQGDWEGFTYKAMPGGSRGAGYYRTEEGGVCDDGDGGRRVGGGGGRRGGGTSSAAPAFGHVGETKGGGPWGRDSMKRLNEEIKLEQDTVDALEQQLGFLLFSIDDKTRKIEDNPCEWLVRTLAEVQHTKTVIEAEVRASKTAIRMAMASMVEDDGKHGTAKTTGTITAELTTDFTLPSQSLRGHDVRAAGMIQKVVGQSGPWGHYAAFQFCTMLDREQQFYGDWICFYHSYSHAAVIYETQSALARELLGMPDDLAPLPRLDRAAFVGNSLKKMRGLIGGGKQVKIGLHSRGD